MVDSASLISIREGDAGFSPAADYKSAAELDCACISLRFIASQFQSVSPLLTQPYVDPSARNY